MLREPLLVMVPTGVVADLLGIRGQTINAWRNRGFLPNFGEWQGDTKARHYGLDEMVVLAIMHDLTAGPAGISLALAAEIGKRCREVLLAQLAGDKPADLFLILEAGAVSASYGFIPADELADYVASWRERSRATKRTRLEIVDLREIAIRTCAKLYWLDAQHSEGRPTEEQVREQVDPIFNKIARWYLSEEIEEYMKSAAETQKQGHDAPARL